MKCEWIRVEDGVPFEKERVLGFDDELIGECVYSNGNFFTSEYCIRVQLTHWMRFPDFPNQTNTKVFLDDDE